MRTRFFFAAAVAAVSVPAVAHADITLPRLFSENCVLQAAAPIPVYGTAEPGEKITVHFRTQTVQATADATGSWSVKLKPEAASETPTTLTVSGAKSNVTIKGVLVGEVWICSGQSNMEWILANAENGEAETKAANDPLLRMFTVPKHTAATPQLDVAGGSWEAATPDTAGHFSAVGYYFARALRQARHVPIGMIHTSWGGTRIQAWASRDTLLASGVPKTEFAALDASPDSADTQKRDAAQKHYEELTALWKSAGSPTGVFKDPGIAEIAKGWSAADLDESDWKPIIAPANWESTGNADLETLDGGVWFRKTFLVAEEDAGKSATLTLGAIDDLDTTFVNGVKVGATGNDTPSYWSVPRRYSIPAGVLKAGSNVVTVRVWDEQGGGGMVGPADAMKLTIDGGRTIPLLGEWRYKIENGRPSAPADPSAFDANTASVLYNGMLAPLAPYGVCGFLWYQGESNAWEQEAARYRVLLPAMIENWRSDFRNPKAPFLLVQLASYKADGEKKFGWAFLREAQSETIANVPYTGMAVITDVSNVDDIHPRKKQPVGERLALQARRIAYKEKVIGSPMLKDWEREASSMLVTFSDAGKGLTVPATARGVLTGWEIAGGDGIYHPGKALIVGKKKDQVRIYSPEVPYPFHVRYGWANVPLGNLFNSEGLPASPFRTDVPLIPAEGK